MRIFSLLAGVAALGAAIFRSVVGAEDIARIAQMAGDPTDSALTGIAWYSISLVLAVFGLALIVSARANRDVAIAVAMLATAMFGGMAAMTLAVAIKSLGDPFALYPVLILAGLAVLAAVAGWQADKEVVIAPQSPDAKAVPPKSPAPKR